ncbi:uncharacterized protein LY79DRAFT_659240 [Colletotrichum navitas]|uniref:Uncharacterized protein n=1 Tax=Colletotrichum navitas TaxID=681940 RepID=A0AAD8PZK1_9PEZI|nr:uncharacterized protein LY79DRAFT_659240 [Colletotrichum navitas]KAK1590901.1 hypothetical protein LY79DRAFT_659240 [Colletotrichum navitas]
MCHPWSVLSGRLNVTPEHRGERTCIWGACVVYNLVSCSSVAAGDMTWAKLTDSKRGPVTSLAIESANLPFNSLSWGYELKGLEHEGRPYTCSVLGCGVAGQPGVIHRAHITRKGLTHLPGRIWRLSFRISVQPKVLRLGCLEAASPRTAKRH